MTLQEKINHSIALIQKTENLALKYSDDGFHLAFSGGKDSQVIYELAKMAGVKFQAFFYKTSVDPKELLLFIRENYPDVIWLRPKMTMFQLILKKKCLPTRMGRYCCEFIKERNALNRVAIIGVRHSESKKRENWQEITFSCKNGCDKNLFAPILDWKDTDVWSFLASRNISACSLYKSQMRIGCIGCPISHNQAKELEQYPNVKKAYENTCQKVIDLNPECGFAKRFKSGKDAVKWWLSDLSIKEYCFMRDHQTKLEL
jgi:phosphoadenosine phosphosulfate reductase